jgi:hypothetical protein
VFGIGVTVANAIALAFKVPGALALVTLVLRMWTILAPVEVSAAETRRRRVILRRWFEWQALLRYWVLVALPAFLLWLLYSVQLDVFFGENSTVGLGGEEVHAIGNNVVKAHLVAILVKLLQDSSAKRFFGRQFQRGEKNECVELFLGQLFELEPLQCPFVPSETHAVITVGKTELFTKEKTESWHRLFVTVVCNAFRKTTLTEFGKSVGRNLVR